MDWNYRIEVFSPPVPSEIQIQSNAVKVACAKENNIQDDSSIHTDKYCSHKDLFRFIVGIDTCVIARVFTFTRQITIGDLPVLLGGIGGVVTHPSYRRRGIASSLVKEAMSELRLAHCDVVYLCTNTSDPRLVGLYAKFGFVVLKKPYTFLGKSGKRYVSRNAMIAPLASKVAFENIINSPIPFDIGVGNW